MPNIDKQPVPTEGKQKESSDTTLSPEEKNKANQILNNPTLINNPDFIAITDESQSDNEENIQNTIDVIKYMIEKTRENTWEVVWKYWLHLNVTYWGEKDIDALIVPQKITTETLNTNDIIFKKWDLKIDRNVYTDIIKLGRELNNIVIAIKHWWSPEVIQSLIEQKNGIIEQILLLSWITDPTLSEYLYTYNGYYDSNQSIENVLSSYLRYQSIEWKTELGKKIINIIKFSDNPFTEIKNDFSTVSENEKIEIARIFSTLFYDNYDDALSEWMQSGDVSDSDMINALKTYITTWKTIPTGVCRHIHAVTAQLLQNIGMEAGIITTNSSWGHVVTLWKKQDGSYFFIDYGNIYEGKKLKDIEAEYMALHGSMWLQETIATPDGKVIGFIKTFLEEMVSKNASAIGTNNTTSYSQDIAQQWAINKVKGQEIGVNVNTDKDVNISYQQWRENWQIGIDANKISANEWNISSVGVGGKVYLGKDQHWAIGGKIANQTIDYSPTEYDTKFSWTTANISWEYAKNLYTDKNKKINIWWIMQGTVLISDREGKSKWFNKIQDVQHESALTISGEQNIGDNVALKVNIGVNEKTDFTNERSANMVQPYFWLQAGWAATYTFDKWGNIGIAWNYSTTTGERTFSTGIQATDKSGKTNIAFNYSNTTPAIPFGDEEISINLGLTRNVTENSKLYINGSYEKHKAYLMAGFKVNF